MKITNVIKMADQLINNNLLHYNYIINTDSKEAIVTQLSIDFLFDDKQHTLAYNYIIRFGNYTSKVTVFPDGMVSRAPEDETYYSVPQVINLNNLSDDGIEIAKMMYSSKEYIESLVENNIGLEKVKQEALDIIIKAGSYVLEGEQISKFEFDRYLGMNTLALDFSLFLSLTKGDTYNLPVTKEYRGNTIRVLLDIYFSEDRRIAHYRYKVNDWQYSEIHKVELSAIEVASLSIDDIIEKLIKYYNILDDVFKAEMEAIDELNEYEGQKQ